MYNLFYCVKMIILEHICFEFVEGLVTKGAAMMATNSFLNTHSAIDMPTSSDVAVLNLVEANSALKLVL